MKTAISLSKGDINEFNKGENNNKMCDFDEYDIFTVQHWDLVRFILLWNAKSIYLFRKLLPLNSIKLNFNLVTKLNLLSTVNITNIDITLYLVKKLQAEYKKKKKNQLLWHCIHYIIRGSPIKSCLLPLSFVLTGSLGNTSDLNALVAHVKYI